MDDPYKLLGVSPDATDDEVKKAYRTMSKKYHPDANIGSPHLEEYTKLFKKVQNAYDMIMDSRKKGYNTWQQQGAYGYNNTTSNVDYQAAANYLNAQHYEEAWNILQGMSNRDGTWFYLSAIANWGLGNQIQANEFIKTAVQLEPQNMQFLMLYQQMQSGRMRYQTGQQPFGGGMQTQDLCCRLMLLNLLCGGCGGGICCC